MRASKQLFDSKMKRPRDYSQRKTSSLLEEGVFVYFRDPGIPFYLPIGRRVLEGIQEILLDEAQKLGISPVEIPAIMRDDVLKEGQEIVDTFNERIVKVDNENLRGYHILTTPEPMILDLASISLTSHNQLPIRFVYNVDIVRGVQRPKGMLKGRQFKTFMGNSLDENQQSLEESLRLFETLSDNIFRRMDIRVHKRRNQGEISIEHFYLAEEGDNLIMPEIDQEKRVKALSLSMAYHYDPKKKVKARFRNRQNGNSRVLYGTFGLGTQRAFYALFDSHRDERGFNLPPELAPFKYAIIPVTPRDIAGAETVYSHLGEKAIIDGRRNVLFGERAAFSDYLGVPWKIISGNGEYTLRSRDGTCERKFNGIERLLNFLKKEESISTDTRENIIAINPLDDSFKPIIGARLIQKGN